MDRDGALELAKMAASAFTVDLQSLDPATREGLLSDIARWLADNQPEHDDGYW